MAWKALTRSDLMEATLSQLQQARFVCRACGLTYGTVSRNVGTSFRSRCHVCGRTSQLRDVRDWGFLRKGIHQLRLEQASSAHFTHSHSHKEASND